MMHAAMGLYADDVDETSRCSDRWRGQIKTLKKIQGKTTPRMTRNHHAAGSLFNQVNHAPHFISLLRLIWKMVRCTDCTHINNNSF